MKTYVGFWRAAVVLILGSMAAACAHAPDITDWRPYQERTYRAVSTKQFEDAVQTVFKSSRPGDYTLRIMPGEISAQRSFFNYLVLASVSGQETWSVKYNAIGADLHATADATSSGQSVGGYIATPFTDRPHFPAQYEILWARLDYMLGLRPDWPVCDTFSGTKDVGQENIGFCSMYWSDVKVAPAQLRRATAS